ncbi:hypothetical protein [Legionella worsleiensis]|uniref:hypothetical protein n=1 Tax=Legionella worsleiensis TaxID=45076 RepID=UPI0007310ACD|nr:hypothetical protein [Legionella worsleiensis]
MKKNKTSKNKNSDEPFSEATKTDQVYSALFEASESLKAPKSSEISGGIESIKEPAISPAV